MRLPFHRWLNLIYYLRVRSWTEEQKQAYKEVFVPKEPLLINGLPAPKDWKSAEEIYNDGMAAAKALGVKVI